MKLVFKTMPVSTNRLYRGRRFLTNEGKQNKEAIAWEARAQFHGDPLGGPLQVSVSLFLPTKRRRDVDNLKGLFDSLSGVLWTDDDQITDLHIKKRHDPKNPRLELEIGPGFTE